MPVPILATKLHVPPPRSNIVFRLRLIERLIQGLQRQSGITLISAPAGFGKTTLVSEWLAASQYSVAWLALDEGDNELSRFLVYFITALQTIHSDLGADVLNSLQSSQPLPIESILTTLLNEVASIPDDFIFVLDDYHLVDSKPIDDVLTFLVEHLPTRMHLVIATREDPPLPLARLRARGQLTELRAADLRFTPAEASDFLNQVMGLKLSTEEIATLETRTEGWIAGLQLAALSMQGHRDTASFIQSFAGTHHFVLDYLLEEVLQQQPESVQTFLLRTSILDRLCGPLCDALLGDEKVSGQKTLEMLEHANLFITALDDERRWYRYHHLFGDLLRQRLGQNLSPDEISKYHIRASAWYEKNGAESEALRHAITARDFSRAAGLCEMAWQGMNGSFQSGTWLGWVKQLPEALIRVHPVLCTQIAWAFMDMGDRAASESRLQDAERCLNVTPDKMIVVNEEQFRSLPARIAIARTYNSLALGNFSDAVNYAELAHKLSPEENHFIRAQASAILAGAYWAKGELDDANKSMSEWIDSAQKAGNFIFAIASASGQADILKAQGRLREALRTLQLALQFASTQGADAQRIIAHHHLGLALLHHEIGNDESAEQYFQKSMELGQQSTQVDWQYRRCIAQARLKESRGDLDAALDLLDEAKRLYVKSLIPYTRPIEALKVRIYLKQGELSKVREWVREHKLSIEDESNYLHEFEHIVLARVLIAEYQISREAHFMMDALTLLEHLLKTAEDAKRMGSLIDILTVQALAHQAQGDTEQASASLERALTLAEPEGYYRTFVEEGEPMAILLAKLESQQLKKYVEKLLSAFEHPKNVQLIPQTLIDPLSERELEVLRLVAQGLSNGEISKQLFLAMSTVKGHNLRIFGKLQAKSRTEAVARARELGLL